MEKIKVTAQQRANAVEALTVMWPSVPKKNIVPALMAWVKSDGRDITKTDCGTVACFGGWCARWPNFRAQGVRVSQYGGFPTISAKVEAFGVAEHLFGDEDLFEPRERFETGTDHAVVSKRLRKLIRESVVV